MTPQYRHAPPKASAMIEALRGLGYSTATALADIIDNSITAGAKNVDLTFFWNGKNSHITIQDDGNGMDEAELDRAMRLGEQSPLDARDSNDLGRFGLGLKTASFSQCRRLTVASRKTDAVGCLRWDLDILTASADDGWHLIEGPADGSHWLLDPLLAVPRGTLVLWENLDRIVTPGFSEQNFLDLIDVVERHLAMVFHRYLSGQRHRLRIAINGRAVVAWDPFLAEPPLHLVFAFRAARARHQGAVSRVAPQRPPGPKTTRSRRRTARLDGATRFLRLPKRAAAGRRKLARPWPRTFLDQGGGASTGKDPTGPPKFGRRGLENRYPQVDGTTPPSPSVRI